MSDLAKQLIEKTSYINDVKQAIKRSIEDKGQTIEDDLSFYSYADKIRQITTMEGVVKLFETEEEMRSDSTAKEGDLAVVYREQVSNMAINDHPQYITFPETVTLPNQLTSTYNCAFKADSNTTMCDIEIRLDDSRFRLDCWGSNVNFQVQYTSTDGINYTRDRFESGYGQTLTNPVDLTVPIKVYSEEQWDDNIGYFMQIDSKYFGGLFEYSLFAYNTKEYARVRKYTDLDNLIIVKIPELSLPSGLTDGDYIYQQIFIQTVESIGSLTTRRKNI